MSLCGTIRLNYIDKVDKEKVKQAVEMLDSGDRNSFYIVQAKQVLGQNTSRNRRSRRSNNVTEQIHVIPNAGFVIWKDKKPVIFFSSKLNGTPSQKISSDASEEAHHHVHNLSSVLR